MSERAPDAAERHDEPPPDEAPDERQPDERQPDERQPDRPRDEGFAMGDQSPDEPKRLIPRGALARLGRDAGAVHTEASVLDDETPVDDAPPEHVEPPPPPVVDVGDLDWAAIRGAASPGSVRARMRDIVERAERLLDAGAPPMLFDEFREGPADRAIAVRTLDEDEALWFIGDLHGDLLALEAALALVDASGGSQARIVFLGDLFDDGGHGLETLLRVLEVAASAPERTCILAGNHDESLGFDGARFTATVSPSDFSDFLNAHLDDELVRRAGQLAIRLFERAPRALFLPDGLLAVHGGIPLADLHEELRSRGDWNDPRCLQDFVWTRAHARSRRKIPNRTSRGSQFGHEDFAAFCAVAAELGRPVHRMVRGHDHEEERFAMHPAWARHPLLTTNAMSRKLAREPFGPLVRVPTVAKWVPGTLPQVHRLHIPEDLVHELYPELEADGDDDASGGERESDVRDGGGS